MSLALRGGIGDPGSGREMEQVGRRLFVFLTLESGCPHSAFERSGPLLVGKSLNWPRSPEKSCPFQKISSRFFFPPNI